MSKYIYEYGVKEITAMTTAEKQRFTRDKPWNFIDLMWHTGNRVRIEPVEERQEYILHFTSVSSYTVLGNQSFKLNWTETDNRVSSEWLDSKGP
jgi:hypothetical protein